jgi:hypothetical protein
MCTETPNQITHKKTLTTTTMNFYAHNHPALQALANANTKGTHAAAIVSGIQLSQANVYAAIQQFQE